MPTSTHPSLPKSHASHSLPILRFKGAFIFWKAFLPRYITIEIYSEFCGFFEFLIFLLWKKNITLWFSSFPSEHTVRVNSGLSPRFPAFSMFARHEGISTPVHSTTLRAHSSQSFLSFLSQVPGPGGPLPSGSLYPAVLKPTSSTKAIVTVPFLNPLLPHVSILLPVKLGIMFFPTSKWNGLFICPYDPLV